mmetsp:Transcript_4797/g.16526  ORF Transcript_4797/g.16526 Transcript_4797/m.16526 type:complete len:224 (+) Transcript_4797:903-1574(+)
MLSSTVTPAPARAPIVSTTLAALVLSSPVVGSSRKRMPGLVRSSVPMLTRRFSPPLRPRTNSSPMRESATLPSPSREIICDTRLKRSSRWVSCGRRSLAWNHMCSRTVAVPGSTSSWDTYPARCRMARRSTTNPSTRTSALSFAPGPGRSRRARASRSVVFPAPLGPRTESTPPSPWESPATPLIPFRMRFTRPLMLSTWKCTLCHVNRKALLPARLSGRGEG